MEEEIIILGAGGHAKVIAESIIQNGDIVVGFLDDDPDIQGKEIYQGKTVLGKISDIDKYKDYKVVIGIGNNKIRQKLAKELDCDWTVVVHPSAVIATDVVINEGTVIMPGVVINPGTVIGRHAIINTGVTLDHDNQIGDYVHISPGAHLAGTVTVGNSTWICTGVTVINNITIGENNTIGAGAVVINNIEDSNSTYVGVPVRKIK